MVLTHSTTLTFAKTKLQAKFKSTQLRHATAGEAMRLSFWENEIYTCIYNCTIVALALTAVRFFEAMI